MDEWIALCMLAAALELLVRDERAALGFESVCGVAMVLTLVRAVMG